MEITASVHSRQSKRKRKANAASGILSGTLQNTRPSEEKMWRHYFYYHVYRWLLRVNGSEYRNPFSRFPAPSAFQSWEDYWRYYSTCFGHHVSQKRKSRDDEEEALLLPKLEADPQEQQLHVWAAIAAAQSFSTVSAVVDESVDAEIDPELGKYWAQRHRLFSRFDDGIKLHREGWYSVTPEEIAVHIAERCRCDTIIDAFCGAGGNAIQFAFTCNHVIAIDVDPVALRVARHNAEVYGVGDRIDFIQGDFMKLGPSLRADVLFLSPPWGGPSYAQSESFDVRSMPIDGVEIFELARRVAGHVAYLLPRNTDLAQLEQLSVAAELPLEVEYNYIDRKIKTITAYFGEYFA